VFGFTLVALQRASAQEAEPRLALVIGNADYASQPLATAANDAGLMAQTLQLAGFDVTAAADLDQVRLRQAVQGFVEDTRRAGPGAIIFVYLAGRGLQYAGENYFMPVDARIARDTDASSEALRLSDLTRALASASARAEIFVLDAARSNSLRTAGAPLASGLALTEAAPGTLIAFNAAPGTIAPDEVGPYGTYARALAEMLREGGLPVADIFARTRVRVNEMTRGRVVPWDSGKIEPPLVLLARAQQALLPEPLSDLRRRPLRELPVQDAYVLAVERDEFDGYRAFLNAFANDPLAKRVQALLAVRREALTWHRAFAADMPAAYWTYMRRYPRGPHLFDARRRLARLAAPLDPPPRFDPYEFVNLPPPLVSDYAWVERRDLSFDLPDDEPPPPLPAYLLAPQPAAFANLPPPTLPERPGLLPSPAPIPAPSSVPPARPGALFEPHFEEPAASAGPPATARPTPAAPAKLPNQSPAPAPMQVLPPSAQLSVTPPRRPADLVPPAPAHRVHKAPAASRPHRPPPHAKRPMTHAAALKSAHPPPRQPQKPRDKKAPRHR